MLETKIEIRMIGHILERQIIFKLAEAIKDLDVEIMHVDVSFAALKAGIEERMPSVMTFFLVGKEEDKKKALERIIELARENDIKIDYIRERK